MGTGDGQCHCNFDTGNPVTIELEPEKMPSKMPKVFTSAIKTQTRCSAVEPLLAEVKAEIEYLDKWKLRSLRWTSTKHWKI